MDLSTVLGSGVVAGLVAGLVTIRTAERKIAIENITHQRKLWREKIREKALETSRAYKDNDLIIEFFEKLALLLKHDWERAKLEAKPVWNSSGKPKRISYDEFKNKRANKTLEKNG